MSEQTLNLLISEPGRIVLKMEAGLALPSQAADIHQQLSEYYKLASPSKLRVYGHDQWTAPIASGSGISKAMIVCPCTTATLSSIANGQSKNLLERAADVTIKEHKKLILVIRETPLSAIHLENMLKLARLGVLIMPANPGFYLGAEKVSELVDFVVARILHHLGIEHRLTKTWGIDEH